MRALDPSPAERSHNALTREDFFSSGKVARTFAEDCLIIYSHEASTAGLCAMASTGARAVASRRRRSTATNHAQRIVS
jgi:hypothetical protein